jgi:hypothetical protein
MSTVPPLWTKPDADGKPRFAQASDEALGGSQCRVIDVGELLSSSWNALPASVREVQE